MTTRSNVVRQFEDLKQRVETAKGADEYAENKSYAAQTSNVQHRFVAFLNSTHGRLYFRYLKNYDHSVISLEVARIKLEMFKQENYFQLIGQPGLNSGVLGPEHVPAFWNELGSVCLKLSNELQENAALYDHLLELRKDLLDFDGISPEHLQDRGQREKPAVIACAISTSGREVTRMLKLLKLITPSNPPQVAARPRDDIGKGFADFLDIPENLPLADEEYRLAIPQIA
ncbi:uncharacterized protein JCM6883_006397 [Sporobolomyces salmoneus]|uniref:uncharacterized protein n=1 Tax=Sporobolomyces salmoneus TaxID=183962 RepID=UPI003178CBF9